MAKLDIDTRKMRECGNEIMKLSISIGEDFTKLFDRIQNMPITTGEWVGQAAVAYANRAKYERMLYLQFKDVLYNYGKYLVDGAEELENEARSIDV